MIFGVVTPDLSAIIHLSVRGTNGRAQTIEAVVDTGFNWFLMLPSDMIARLDLLFSISTLATLGDGSEVQLNIYEAAIEWDGRERIVEALQTEGGALIGMALLKEHELRLQVRDGGAVAIEALA